MKIKFGAILTDGRGKIGGHVASKNRGGAYMRTKVTPSNPNTISQATARGILSSLSQAWRGLADEQRLSWNNAVSDWSKTDIFGDIKNPTGLNLYVKLNANLSNVGLALLNTPQGKIDMPVSFIESVSYNSGTDVMVVTFSNGNFDGESVIIRATPPVSAGKSFVKNLYRIIGSDIVALGVATLTGNYSDKFGTVSVGSVFYVSAQVVLASGQKSVESIFKVIVTV